MGRPWVKSWTNVLDKRKIMSLPGDLYKVWDLLCRMAGRYDQDGMLPPLDDCAYVFHKDEAWLLGYIDQLCDRTLIDREDGGYRMHDWQEWQTQSNPSYPSDAPAATRERKRAQREREKTVVTSVTSRDIRDRDSHEVTTEENRGEERRVEKKPPVANATAPKGQRGARIPSAWPIASDLPLMIAYGDAAGIVERDTEAHIREYHDYWSAATKNATSLDWVKRWRARFSQDVREGKIGVRRSPGGGPRRTSADERLERIVSDGDAAYEIITQMEARKHGRSDLSPANRLAGGALPADRDERDASRVVDFPRRGLG